MTALSEVIETVLLEMLENSGRTTEEQQPQKEENKKAG